MSIFFIHIESKARFASSPPAAIASVRTRRRDLPGKFQTCLCHHPQWISARITDRFRVPVRSVLFLISVASLIGRWGQGVFRLSTLAVSMVAKGLRASSYGIGTKALPIMGFEDEVEQPTGRLCRRTNGRSSDERTHLIHRPARDIRSTARWSSSFLLLHIDLYGRHSLRLPGSSGTAVPSTQICGA